MSSFPNIIYGDYGQERDVSLAKMASVRLGQRMVLPDGTEYLYSRMGAAALLPGNLYQGQAVAAGTGNIVSIAVIAGSAAAGGRSVSVTMSATGAMTKDQYADGSVFTVTAGGGGVGYRYRIKSCSSAAAGSTSVLTLHDKVHTTIAGGTTLVGLRVSSQDLALLTTADTVGVSSLSGVGCATAAASSYCWLQVRGEAAVLTDGTVVVGQNVVPSPALAGAIAPRAAATTAVDLEKSSESIGYVMSVAASTGYSLIDLKIK